MLIGLVHRGMPVDLIMFSDTGGERPETYSYTVGFSMWLQSRGYPAITVVFYTDRAGNFVKLEDDCLRKGVLPSLAYGRKGCSLKWKRDPQHKHLNNWAKAREAWAQDLPLIRYIGFDADEERRTFGSRYRDTAGRHDYQYPLIKWGWGRWECGEVIKRAGLPLPPKSSCFFCPASTIKEVRLLRIEKPELYRRSLDMESRAQAQGDLMSVKGLGRRWAWLDIDANDCAQFDIFNGPPCDCYDGWTDEDEKPLVSRLEE